MQLKHLAEAKKSLRIAFVGSSLPRRCGIATFIHDLGNGIESVIGRNSAINIALDDVPEGYDYPPRVVKRIAQQRLVDYIRAAEYIDRSDVDMVSLHFEYGLFGGEDGSYIVEFLGNLRKPVVSTLHTVLEHPTIGQKKVLTQVAAFSESLIVMNELAIDILKSVYGIENEKVKLIYHGVEDSPYIAPAYYKHRLGLQDRRVLLTFGFISRNKGIENVLYSLPPVVSRYPETLYIVAGMTHPVVRKAQGEEYRDFLEHLCIELKIEKNVRFVNEFIDDKTLGEYLGAADAVILPYNGEEQITSGVLSFALGRGKPIISTPFTHARQALSNGRGLLANFRDPVSFTESILRLFDDDDFRQQVAKLSYGLGRQMIWSKVGREYVSLYEHTVDDATRKASFRGMGYVHAIPPVDLSYLSSITDGTGVLQHTIYGVPDRRHGYSTDDVGRALAVCTEYHNLFRYESSMPLINNYLSFIAYAQRADGWFNNFMEYGRRFVDEDLPGGEDTFGRAMWGLGRATNLRQCAGQDDFAREIFDRSLHRHRDLTYTRAMAYTVRGLNSYLGAFPQSNEAWDAIKNLGERLLAFYQKNSAPDWEWFESFLSYDNARLPHAMLLAFRHTGRQEFFDVGRKTLDFLIDLQFKDGYFSFVGNCGWYHRGDTEMPLYDEQPLEAAAMVECCLQAHIISGDEKYIEYGYAAFQWFIGRNRLGLNLYDPQIAGCADALMENGVNHNMGAESTIMFLKALLTLYRWELQDRFFEKKDQ
jgi:glycosyltransferase involved in cell wall biosynthesis